jgi:hypothetical protein
MLEQATIIALLVLSIWYTYQEGEIFGFVQKWETSIGKPFQALFGCNVCMTPWYGSVLYWLIYGLWLNVATWQAWLVVVITAMGINAAINKLSPDK